MFQVFSTSEGVVRRRGGATELIVENSDLNQMLTSGGWDALADLPGVGAINLDDVVVRAPVRPTNVFIVGLNYRSHAEEVGQPIPTSPIFSRIDSEAVCATADAIPQPAQSDKVDYEGEIGVVIARDGDHVSADHAWSYVAGLTAVNDVTARDLQMAAAASYDFEGIAAAKSFPGFKPLGPGVLVTSHPADVELIVTVNGEVRQRAALRDMIFGIPALIEAVSAAHPLKAGDLISTGSPAGVGLVSNRFLADGDVVEVKVGDLPPLRNSFVGSVSDG